jgi:hypothetical protein
MYGLNGFVRSLIDLDGVWSVFHVLAVFAHFGTLRFGFEVWPELILLFISFSFSCSFVVLVDWMNAFFTSQINFQTFQNDMIEQTMKQTIKQHNNNNNNPTKQESTFHLDSSASSNLSSSPSRSMILHQGFINIKINEQYQYIYVELHNK